MSEQESGAGTPSRGEIIEALIRVGLIAALAVMCIRVVAPFMDLVLWGLILAIALYPLHRKLAARLGGRPGRSATLIVLAGLILLGAPTVILGGSFAAHVHDAYSAFESSSLHIEPPPESVSEVPVIGERVHAVWSAAAANLPALMEANQAQLRNLSRSVLRMAAGTAGAVLLFLGALIVAGIIMAYGESGSGAMDRIFRRLVDPVRGPGLQQLSTATVRSVAMGVVGVAFIQALILGVGFLLAGVPGAGVLALIVLLVGIVQLPALLVSLPVIAYLWWAPDGSTAMNVVFTVYLLVAGMADNVLKPLLLGRGVDVPMPVILIGALGGMVVSGIVGLFVGAVVLAVGYEVFMAWVDGAADRPVDEGQSEMPEGGARPGE